LPGEQVSKSSGSTAGEAAVVLGGQGGSCLADVDSACLQGESGFKVVEKQIADPDGPNPFIDTEVWGAYLDQKREELLAFMADPRNN
jgi:hypothetical protein